MILENIEATITMSKKLNSEEVNKIEKSATELLGGSSICYAELKQDFMESLNEPFRYLLLIKQKELQNA